LFAVWFLFLCGCTFYVHKRISLNTKTTCGNSNNNKAKTHAHTHTHPYTNTHIDTAHALDAIWATTEIVYILQLKKKQSR